MSEDIPIHNTQELLPDILRTPHAPRLDIVLIAPRVRELARLPPVVYRQQGQMVALRLMELGLFAIRLRLLLFRPVEDVLYAQHCDDGEDLFGTL